MEDKDTKGLTGRSQGFNTIDIPGELESRTRRGVTVAAGTVYDYGWDNGNEESQGAFQEHINRTLKTRIESINNTIDEVINPAVSKIPTLEDKIDNNIPCIVLYEKQYIIIPCDAYGNYVGDEDYIQTVVRLYHGNIVELLSEQDGITPITQITGIEVIESSNREYATIAITRANINNLEDLTEFNFRLTGVSGTIVNGKVIFNKVRQGKSAYEVWKDAGNEGNVEVFLASLKESGFTTKAVSTRPDAIDDIDDKTIYAIPNVGDNTWSEYIYIGDMSADYNSNNWLLLATHDGSGLSSALANIESLKDDFGRVPSIISDLTKAHVFVSASEDRSVINICDIKGNIAMSVRNGNVYVSQANTEILGSFKENNDGEFSISDQRGNIAFKVNENGVSFKKAIANELTLGGVDVLQLINGLTQDTLKFLNTDEGDIIRLIDKRGYILAIISENGVTTKNSVSSDIDITVVNSDAITLIGSSFGETGNFPINKHWSGIISMFLDYRIQNLSLSGSNKVTALHKIRKGDWKPIGKYCLVANDENFNFDSHQHTRALDNLCKCLLSLGIEPVICTSYHKDGCLSSEYKNYADEHNYMMLDAAHYCHDLNAGIVDEFDNGTHLRKRNIPMVADAYLPQLMRMENPMQSIKIFRVRNTSINDLDELVFTSNVERAKVFREITVSNSSNVDEYNKLANGSSLSFTKYALISCVLPAVGKDIGSVKLSFVSNDDNIVVYAKNDMVSPYPDPTLARRARFSINEEIVVPSENDVYTVDGKDYTVSYVIMGENGYYCTIYCTPRELPSIRTDGLMTKKSGQGEDEFLYAMVEDSSAYTSQYVSEDNNGHYVELTKNDGVYRLPEGDGYIDYDKVNFLLVSSGSFTLADIHVICNAANKKQRKSRILFEWSENEELPTNELLTETTFGSVGTNTSAWKDDANNSLTSQSSYGNKYPSGCSSLVRISDEVAMNYTVPSASLTKNGKIWLEICCRYFPTAPNPYSQANDMIINDSSYDYATLYVQFGQEARKAIVENEVGLMWKKVRVPITWYHPLSYKYSNINSEALPIRLYSSKELEVCKVSLKYEC